MERTEVSLENKRGEIQLFSDDKKAGIMEVALAAGNLIVYHTEVDPAYEGKGFARLLLDKLVAYARENNLKIKPLCPYVHAQFKRRPDEYSDVWLKND